MKKTLLLAAAATAMVVAPAVQANTSFALGGAVQNSEIKLKGAGKSSDTGYKVFGAAEADLTADGYVGARLGVARYGSYFSTTVSSIYVDAYYGHRIIPNGSVLGFVGIGSFKAGSQTESTAQFGVGYRHTFGPWAVQAELPFYELLGSKLDDVTFKAKAPSVGVSYHF